MFSQVCVILSRGGGGRRGGVGYLAEGGRVSGGVGYTPCIFDHPPDPQKRAVRILLESFLVKLIFYLQYCWHGSASDSSSKIYLHSRCERIHPDWRQGVHKCRIWMWNSCIDV